MNPLRKLFVFIFLWTLVTPVPGQTASSHNRKLNRVSVESLDDMGQIKLLAEHGNAKAQIKIASTCMNNRLYADALQWYSAAADQRVQEAGYQKGHLLLFGCQGTSPEQCVTANPSEGLRIIYQTATNGHSGACLDMGQALKDGIGCAADPVAAYAWFSLCSDTGDSVSKRIMNELALRLSTEDIRSALAGAREMKAGHWKAFPTTPTVRSKTTQLVAINLKLSGVVCSPSGNLAIINNRTLSKGETAQFMTDQKEPIAVTCQNIYTGGVELQVGDEAQSRILVSTSR